MFNILGPAHFGDFGKVIISLLEGFPEAAVGGVGDEDDSLHLPVIHLVLRLWFGDSFLLFTVSSLLGQGQTWFVGFS